MKKILIVLFLLLFTPYSQTDITFSIESKYGDVFGTEESGADYDILNVKEVLSIVKKENQE